MAFMAAAIPIASAVLGAMSSKPEQQQPQQAVQPPPTLGEIFAMNEQQAQPLPLPGQSNRGS